MTAEAFVTIRPEMSRFNNELRGGLAGAARFAGAAMLGVGAAITGVAVAGLREFATLERGMNEVFTLAPGMSEEAMGKMTEDVRSFSREMGTSTTEVVPALYQAISAGVPTDNVFTFLETANKAAIGGVTDLETAVDGISSVVNAYGDDVIDAAQASDLMFTAVRLGKTNFEELSSSLFQVLPTASALGVEFGDVTAALAEMTAQGVPTSVATSQLRAMMVELSRDSGKASDAFKEVAGEGFASFIEGGGNVADALDIMQQAADENGVSLQDMFSRVEAGNAALALAGGGTDDYRDALAEMADAAGATDAAHEQMDQGLSRAWERIKTNIGVALGEIGERLAPTFQGFADWVVDNMPAITDFVVGAFETIAGFITNQVVPAFQALIGWWQDNGPGIVATVTEVWDQVTAVLETVRGWIDTVTGWFDAFRNDVGGSQSALLADIMPIWEQIKGVFSSAFDAIHAIVTWFIGAVQYIWEKFGDNILRFLKATWENVRRVISGVLNVIQGIFEVFAGLFTGDWSRMWNGIKQIISGAWQVIVGVVRQAINIVWNVIKMAVAGISALWSAAHNAMRRVLSAAWSAIVSGVRSGIDRVLAFIRGLPRRIISGLGNVNTMLLNVGKAIIRGMVNGIKSMARAPVDAVRSIGSSIVGGAKSLLGIGSPSKVFMGIGEDTTEGLALGLAKDAERVSRTMLGMLEVPNVTIPRSGMSPLSPVSGLDMPTGRDPLAARLDRIAMLLERGQVIEMDGDRVGRSLRRGLHTHGV